MERSEATKSSTMKVSIVLCLLLKLSKAIGEDAVDNIDNEEIHGTGLLDPPEDEKVDEASELYFNHFRSLRSVTCKDKYPDCWKWKHWCSNQGHKDDACRRTCNNC